MSKEFRNNAIKVILVLLAILAASLLLSNTEPIDAIEVKNSTVLTGSNLQSSVGVDYVLQPAGMPMVGILNPQEAGRNQFK